MTFARFLPIEPSDLYTCERCGDDVTQDYLAEEEMICGDCEAKMKEASDT
jgi:predicted nucleic acid-binding Zn ribbon protein